MLAEQPRVASTKFFPEQMMVMAGISDLLQNRDFSCFPLEET